MATRASLQRKDAAHQGVTGIKVREAICKT